MKKSVGFIMALLGGAIILTALISGCGDDSTDPKAKVTATAPPDGGTLKVGSTLTITFDHPLKSVSVNGIDANIDGKIATWTASEQLTPGNVNFKIEWTNRDGSEDSKTIQLEVVGLTPPSKIVSTEPIDGGTVKNGDSLTITFDNAPKSVTVNGKATTVAGKVATWTVDGLADGDREIVIAWKNQDNSDGEGETITLKVVTPLPASDLLSTDPVRGSTVKNGDSLTINFDNTPKSVTVNDQPANIDGTTALWTIDGLADGDREIVIAWKNQDDSDGEGKTITLKVVTPPPPSKIASVNPIDGSTVENGDSLSITFDNAPKSVTVNGNDATLSDAVATWTIVELAIGENSISIAWKNQDDSDGGEKTITLKVAPPPSKIVSTEPIDGSTVENGDNLTITFDNAPKSVTVNGKQATLSDEVATWTIDGLADGDREITIGWRNQDNSDGDGKAITLKVATPPPPSKVAFVNPIDGSTVKNGDSLSINFDNAPKSVTVNGNVASLSNTVATWTIAELADGDREIVIAWKNQDDSDGEGKTITLKVATPAPPSKIVSTEPIDGSAVKNGDSLSITFDNAPKSVTVNGNVASLSDAVATWIISELIDGDNDVKIAWKNQDNSDGEGKTINLTVDLTAPTVTGGDVQNNASEVNYVDLNENGITIEFSEIISEGTISLQVGDSTGETLNTSLDWKDKSVTIYLDQESQLKDSETYLITVADVADRQGNLLENPTISFTTEIKTGR